MAEKQGPREGERSYFNSMDMFQISKKQSQEITNEKKINELKKNNIRYQELLRTEEYLKSLRRLTEAEKAQLKRIAEERQQIEKLSADAAAAYRRNVMRVGTSKQKEDMLKSDAEVAAAKRVELKKQFDIELAMARDDAKLKKFLQTEFKKANIAAIQEEFKTKEKLNKLQNNEAFKTQVQIEDSLASIRAKGFKNKLQGLRGLTNVPGNLLEDNKANTKNAQSQYDLASDKLDALLEAGASENSPAVKAARQQLAVAEQQLATAKRQEGLAEKANQLAKQMSNDYDQAYKAAETAMNEYMGHVNARLQGSDKTYETLIDKVTDNLAINPYVRSKDVIDNMKKAVDEGVVYNVEQRAFLETISEKVANTFDAFDSNLTRLIRLQQSDSTAARLGMEASLTTFLNKMYEDSSYLSDMFDSVSGELLNAVSIMNRDSGTEFEYTVQKWLSSLYSLGISSNAVSSIAQGLNYVATGDVQKLASNSSLQTVIAMSASKAGLEYSDLLLNGLDASNTNKLLTSMVGYLKEIAEGSDNNVVRAAYGDIFNLTMSDFKAISNLSNSDIQNISKTSMNYSSMIGELNNQLHSLMFDRTSISEAMSNIYQNAIFSTAQNVVSNPLLYSMKYMLNTIDDMDLDMAIPFISAFGTGVDLNTTIDDIMKLASYLPDAIGIAGTLLSGIGSLGSNMGMDLDVWGGTDTTRRGTGLTFSSGRTLGGKSGSAYVGNSSYADIKSSSLASATADAEESSEITNANHKTTYTFDDFYQAVIGDTSSSYIVSKDLNINDAYNSTANFIGVQDSRLTFMGDKLNVNDKSLIEITQGIAENTHTGTSILEAVTTKDNAIAVKIKSISDAVTINTHSTLSSIDAKIDTKPIINTIRSVAEQLTQSSNAKGKDIKTITDLYYLLTEDGSKSRATVNVMNADGYKLQVDTELGGATMYEQNMMNW